MGAAGTGASCDLSEIGPRRVTTAANAPRVRVPRWTPAETPPDRGSTRSTDQCRVAARKSGLAWAIAPARADRSSLGETTGTDQTVPEAPRRPATTRTRVSTRGSPQPPKWRFQASSISLMWASRDELRLTQLPRREPSVVRCAHRRHRAGSWFAGAHPQETEESTRKTPLSLRGSASPYPRAWSRNKWSGEAAQHGPLPECEVASRRDSGSFSHDFVCLIQPAFASFMRCNTPLDLFVPGIFNVAA